MDAVVGDSPRILILRPGADEVVFVIDAELPFDVVDDRKDTWGFFASVR
jgi:hypothetical protein